MHYTLNKLTKFIHPSQIFNILKDDPKIKMLVLLGEVGGIEEYTVCELLKEKRITKPIVAWCIGTCSDVFSTDVQVSSVESYTMSETVCKLYSN